MLAGLWGRFVDPQRELSIWEQEGELKINSLFGGRKSLSNPTNLPVDLLAPPILSDPPSIPSYFDQALNAGAHL